jgi:integrase
MTTAANRNNSKPAKPYKDFPLFPHPNGQWCKKFKGIPKYFGKWEDPDSALQEYRERREGIRLGRDPKFQAVIQVGDSITAADTVNLYLETQDSRRKRGEITDRHFSDCILTCRRLVEYFGRHITTASLHPSDFTRFRNSFPVTWGIARAETEIARVQAVFRWAEEEKLIDTAPKFGASFKKTDKRVKRREKAKREAEHGKKEFMALEVRCLLSETDDWLRACILLGINAGFGNRDCSELQKSHISFESGWYDLRRGKTGIPRRAYLWPETRQAIRNAMNERPIAALETNNCLCFLSRRGNPLVNEIRSESGTLSVSDNVSTACSKALKRLGLTRKGRNFYSLRRTFETVGGNFKDQVAVNYSMGHEDESMAAVYRQGIDGQRLIDVAEHVRQWLWTRKCDSCGETQFSVDDAWTCEGCSKAAAAEE